mmetsp:Transcript_22148/g.71552  ORF Transcript_22148/g.71552 Transcript_22148/m.71552 type:complete len:247 (+) Transcript_22148:216-956(+)
MSGEKKRVAENKRPRVPNQLPRIPSASTCDITCALRATARVMSNTKRPLSARALACRVVSRAPAAGDAENLGEKTTTAILRTSGAHAPCPPARAAALRAEALPRPRITCNSCRLPTHCEHLCAHLACPAPQQVAARADGRPGWCWFWPPRRASSPPGCAFAPLPSRHTSCSVPSPPPTRPARALGATPARSRRKCCLATGRACPRARCTPPAASSARPHSTPWTPRPPPPAPTRGGGAGEAPSRAA